MAWIAIVGIGLGVGFLAGLFGKGGSAVATPLLAAAGVPPLVALTAPLPAAIPTSLAGELAYRGSGGPDRRVLLWSAAFGVPATIAGALASRLVGGTILLRATDLLIFALGLRLTLRRRTDVPVVPMPRHPTSRLAFVATGVGLVSGLLANSGGFLLAPLYVIALRMPIKRAFATSLAVAAILAVPGTLAHWELGHLDWTVVAVFAAASVPTAFVGARVAVRTSAPRLERIYGAALVLLGPVFLALSFR
ncbi:MAG TPA: sulfite exporter TauE/SafE family protein [Actinomycetota bacterium]|nr:sulfite exporter TauE/SafE family protein [Actinomycetota bacterium]